MSQQTFTEQVATYHRREVSDTARATYETLEDYWRSNGISGTYKENYENVLRKIQRNHPGSEEVVIQLLSQGIEIPMPNERRKIWNKLMVWQDGPADKSPRTNSDMELMFGAMKIINRGKKLRVDKELVKETQLFPNFGITLHKRKGTLDHVKIREREVGNKGRLRFKKGKPLFRRRLA